MLYDLRDTNTRLSVQRQLKMDIDAYCVAAYSDKRRSHLGASVIGHECARFMWYSFRWCIPNEGFSGRMLRLFQRGHLEEFRFVEYLRGIGCNMVGVTADGAQIRIGGAGGHFGGSQDGQAGLPAHYQIMQPLLLAEFKTKGRKKWPELVKNGVMLAEPRHYAQMCTYGWKETEKLRAEGSNQSIDFALYMSTCKDDDDIHLEIVPLDHLYGQDLERKAEAIIFAKFAPRKIAATPAFFTCKFCDARSVCWEGAPVAHNCRSCKFAEPRDNKVWHCTGYGQDIPADVIERGCPHHQSVALAHEDPAIRTAGLGI